MTITSYFPMADALTSREQEITRARIYWFEQQGNRAAFKYFRAPSQMDWSLRHTFARTALAYRW
jgi:hypothetical protein